MRKLNNKVRFIHENLDPVLCDRFASHVARWRGTPYKLFSQAPGRLGGTDCVRFVTGLTDDVIGQPRQSIPRHMSDAAMHAPETSRAIMRELMKMYDYRMVQPDEDGWYNLLPMDMLIMAPEGGGPGHGVVVGVGQLWHCTEVSGVQATGLHMDMELAGVCRRKWQ